MTATQPSGEKTNPSYGGRELAHPFARGAEPAYSCGLMK
jgi:hypothetical protein